MKKYDFDQTIERKQTYSIKMDQMPEGAPEDALSLWVADMDFPCADPIIAALHKRVDQLIFGYTHYKDEYVKETIQKWFQKRYDWQVPQDQIFYSPGIVPAIAFLVNILSEEGDGILIQRPIYYPFTDKILNNNRKVVNNPLIYRDGTYEMDFEDLEVKMAMDTTKGMILCNPHNPVGRVWTASDLKKVVEICKKYDKWIISDEIHADIVRKGKIHLPLTKVESVYDKIIVCTAPSKTFNLAGLHISNIIIPNKEYQQRWNYFLWDRFSVQLPNPLSITAMVAAYQEGEEWLDQVNAYIDDNISYCMAFFAEHLPKAHVIFPEATYLLWIDFSAYFDDHKEMEKVMMQQAKVALDEGYIFGEEGQLFERINLASPRRIIVDCLERIKKAIEEK